MAKVLLADDEPGVLQSVDLLLRSEGHEVTALRDSSDAARLLQEEKFDLFITDIRMTPVDGMQLLQLAHDTHPEMPTIVISAYGADATQQESYNLGCRAYIKKPFVIDEVLAAVAQVLSET